MSETERFLFNFLINLFKEKLDKFSKKKNSTYSNDKVPTTYFYAHTRIHTHIHTHTHTYAHARACTRTHR